MIRYRSWANTACTGARKTARPASRTTWEPSPLAPSCLAASRILRGVAMAAHFCTGSFSIVPPMSGLELIVRRVDAKDRYEEEILLRIAHR